MKKEDERDFAADGESVGSENGERELHLLLRHCFKSCPYASPASRLPRLKSKPGRV